MPLFKKISENCFEVNEVKDSLLKQLEAKIKQKYPNVVTSIDTDSEGNPILDIDTGETNFYVSQGPNEKFSVSAVWSKDEKGKKNLDTDSMVKAVSSIPGMT